ncbi:MAG: DMT family protein [Pseudomonadota bacterium]|nr:DMT family protein [Pseudomonadota bacterium]
MSPFWKTVGLLVLSNIFMTFAWYGHLRDLRDRPLWIAIGASWGIAFFEYCIQVPANRLGFTLVTLQQLKILQEIVTLVVFAGFAVFWMGEKLTWNYGAAGLCMCGAAWFMFRA